MSKQRQHWFATVFVLLGLTVLCGLFLVADGRWRVDSELPGLLAGLVLVVLLWIGIARR
jgi:uncharacterized membrane protein YwaF